MQQDGKMKKMSKDKKGITRPNKKTQNMKKKCGKTKT